MEKYRGRVKNGFSGLWVTIIDDSGLLKYQDEVEIVIHSSGDVTLMIDDQKAVERQREEWNEKLN